MLGYSQAAPSSIRITWTCICDILSLVGAYVADEHWGRFKTFSIFGFWHVGGGLLLSILAYPDLLQYHPSIANALFLIALFLV